MARLALCQTVLFSVTYCLRFAGFYLILFYFFLLKLDQFHNFHIAQVEKCSMQKGALIP